MSKTKSLTLMACCVLSPSPKMFVLGGDTWWNPSEGKDNDAVMCSWDYATGLSVLLGCFSSNSFQVDDDNLHRLSEFGE